MTMASAKKGTHWRYFIMSMTGAWSIMRSCRTKLDGINRGANAGGSMLEREMLAQKGDETIWTRSF